MTISSERKRFLDEICKEWVGDPCYDLCDVNYDLNDEERLYLSNFEKEQKMIWNALFRERMIEKARKYGIEDGNIDVIKFGEAITMLENRLKELKDR